MGMAKELTETSAFETCVAENVASSFLGRPLTSDDDILKDQLAATFAKKGYKMRALVQALVESSAYRDANNLSSAAWREMKP